jgi:translocation and assembly module TamB
MKIKKHTNTQENKHIPNNTLNHNQSLQRPDDVVLLRNGRPTDKSKRRDPIIRADLKKVMGENVKLPPLAAEQQTGRAYWITVDAPRNLWIRGDDVNAEIGLSEGFRVEYTDKALLFGEVQVRRARLDVLGRRFDVRNDSSIRFAGPALKPYVNATAVYKNEQAQTTVYLTVRGQGTDISLKVSSDPPLSESEIYTLLATGRVTLKRGSGSAMSGGEAASIIGSLAASQLKKSLASKLPLDVLSIEAGQGGLQGSKLEAGTYVTDKVYVGYTGRLGADPSKGENSNAVKLEYQISPHWSLEMEYGDARAGGADVIWTRDY